MTATYEKNLSSLLEAEERANKIIRDAEEKRDRMKDEAIDRARKEVEDLRAQMEEEFNRTKVDTTKEEKDIKIKAEIEIKKNEALFVENKEKVAEMLLERILSVSYELQRNVKADFKHLLNN